MHGHYADAGEVASMVASTMASTETGLDMVMTGHSLGRNKLEHLLATGTHRTIQLFLLIFLLSKMYFYFLLLLKSIDFH